ncbi:MAG TPA: sugar phosphate nucleotidyltransferase [bacterium]|nr:sugar phosphate nucleotidyltransferase [bacterium]
MGSKIKPALLIMAAGMGSRYGGLKQLETLGPGGATLLDFSLYDAIRAGFGKIVFIIRRDIEDDFKKIVGKKWESRIPVRYVFQELGMVPEGFRISPARQKPWGTGHAIWVAQGAIQEPFAVINADDFYGRESFRVLAKFLKGIKDPEKPEFSMVGFILKKTLSEHGSVSRGVCQKSPQGFLRKVEERMQIGKNGFKYFYLDAQGRKHSLKGTETVSMNMWGFTPVLFDELGRRFKAFLKEKGQEEKSEFLIPRVVDELVHEKKARVKVLRSKDQWFGVTYPQDKDQVREKLTRLIAQKRYPGNLGG